MLLNSITAAIFFITGTSGSGKTTLVPYLKTQLPKSHFEVYDFDEIGVPTNADAAWRKKTTAQWLIKAQENSAQGKSTIICGVSVPSEIVSCSPNPPLPIYFGYIEISEATIKTRLQLRNWNAQLIQDNINWAQYLHTQVQQQKDHLIVHGDNATPEEVAQMFIEWIKNR